MPRVSSGEVSDELRSYIAAQRTEIGRRAGSLRGLDRRLAELEAISWLAISHDRCSRWEERIEMATCECSCARCCGCHACERGCDCRAHLNA